VETELLGPRRNQPIIQYPDYAQLDFAAMRRELLRASKSVAAAAEATAAQQRAEALRDAAFVETNLWREALNGANMRASTAEWDAYGHRVAAEKATEEAAAALRLAASAAEDATEARRQAATADERAANADEQAVSANEQAAHARQEAHAMRQEAHALRQAADALRQEIDDMQREAEQVRDALAVAQTEATKLQGEIAALRSSRSWRLTRPYRDAHVLLNRLLRGGQ
jgi:chromosome segregation ATPase